MSQSRIMNGPARSAALVLCLPAAAAAYLGLRAASPTAEEALRRLPGVVRQDLGEVRQHRGVRLAATLENPASEPVTVEAVMPDCGCAPAAADYAGRPIPAGGLLEVAAEYGAHAAGPFERAVDVTLRTASGQAVRRRFIFEGTVSEQLTVSPPAIHAERPGGEHECVLEVAFDGPLEADSVRLHPEGDYRAELRREGDDRTTLTLGPTRDEAGAYAGTVYVRLTSPRRETLAVPVRLGVPAGPTLAD